MADLSAERLTLVESTPSFETRKKRRGDGQMCSTRFGSGWWKTDLRLTMTTFPSVGIIRSSARAREDLPAVKMCSTMKMSQN
jgi:hypothetical protein